MAEAGPERVFYDGGCGLCHGGVRFLLRRDPEGRAFRFAPLGGPTFRAELDGAALRDLPDSFVVVTRDRRILVRSEATAHALAALGGAWRWAAAALRLVPRPVRDFGYDRVAAVRTRLFARSAGTCPAVSDEERRRFDP